MIILSKRLDLPEGVGLWLKSGSWAISAAAGLSALFAVLVLGDLAAAGVKVHLFYWILGLATPLLAFVSAWQSGGFFGELLALREFKDAVMDVADSRMLQKVLESLATRGRT